MMSSWEIWVTTKDKNRNTMLHPLGQLTLQSQLQKSWCHFIKVLDVPFHSYIRYGRPLNVVSKNVLHIMPHSKHLSTTFKMIQIWIQKLRVHGQSTKFRYARYKARSPKRGATHYLMDLCLFLACHRSTEYFQMATFDNIPLGDHQCKSTYILIISYHKSEPEMARRIS